VIHSPATAAGRRYECAHVKADCPVAVTVVPGATFKCELLKDGSFVGHATVTILNDQGELSVSGA
jgi:hypothetical protein